MTLPLAAADAVTNAYVAQHPEAVGTWLIVGLFVMAGVGNITAIFSLFATRRETAAIEKRMDAHETVHKELFSKMGGMERGLRAEMATETKTLARDIGETRTAITELQTECRHQSRILENIARKLNVVITGHED